jgi:hypothetical protein
MARRLDRERLPSEVKRKKEKGKSGATLFPFSFSLLP